MRIAIIGSRSILKIDIERYIPNGICLLITGGAVGIDSIVENYANKKKIPKLVFKPDYKAFGKIAPLIRNMLIVENADTVIAIWDGISRGTKFTIDYAKKTGKPVSVYIIN